MAGDSFGHLQRSSLALRLLQGAAWKVEGFSQIRKLFVSSAALRLFVVLFVWSVYFVVKKVFAVNKKSVSICG
jgi:hypothetical protein